MAANTSLRGLKSLVIEKQDIPGGLSTLLYPDKIIRDHPGFPVGILGKELSRVLVMQSKTAGAEIKCREEVVKILPKKPNRIEVTTVAGAYHARRVIIATGIYNIPRKLEVLQDAPSTNIHFKVDRLDSFKNRDVVIVGGGDHAFDTAIQLETIANGIQVLVKDKYAKAKQTSVDLANQRGIKIRYNSEITKAFTP